MSKTAFSKRCNVLSDWWEMYAYTSELPDDWQLWRIQYWFGISVAHAVHNEFAIPTPEGTEVINTVWDSYCDLLGIDKDKEYDTVKETFDECEANNGKRG